MTLREDLRDLNARLEPDDAPLWAEVLGAVLAPFVALRGGLHAATALVAADLTGEAIDPHLTGHGLTLASPVQGLRGHRADRVARYLVGVVGLFGLTHVGWYAIGHPVVDAWIAVNLAACAADPAAWLALVAQDRLTDRHPTHNA